MRPQDISLIVRPMLILALWGACLAHARPADASDQEAPGGQSNAQSKDGRPAWETLDIDGDERLSQSEYVGDRADAGVRARDFQLFDANRDGLLTEGEFQSIPSPGFGRGAVPDPMWEILDRAIAAMDDSYDGWQYRSDETVDSTTFAINYVASISPTGLRRLDRVLMLHADPNRDRKVSREEARRFLESQLGIRWITGEPLRYANGRVLNFAEFLFADADHDDQLSRQEFVDNWWNAATAEDDFRLLDTDQDQRITITEFGSPAGPNLRDPIQDFRRADTNLDAALDAAELRAATAQNRVYLVRSNLAAFDSDGDGKLSLTDYRLSMLGNYNCMWENKAKDEDRDLHLSFDEFKFDSRELFQLQRRYYFHRLDKDHDDRLSPEEFDFRMHKQYSLYRISTGGERSRQIYQHEDYATCSSPAISPDGKWILFDAAPPEGPNKSRILLISSDGQQIRDVCDGLMPSWSSDGSRLACSRYEGGSGVWIMNLDGTAERRIDDGWAAQWSPNGHWIAYTNDNSIRVFDVQNEKSRTVLAKGDHPYGYLYWNMGWSPDSRRLVFKGKLPDRNEIAIINVHGEPSLKRYFHTRLPLGSDFAWTPDGRRILFCMHSREHRRSVLYQMDLESGGPPKIVPEANTALAWTSVCVSPDGNWMVAVTPN